MPSSSCMPDSVPATDDALPSCTATEILCSKKFVSLGSLVTSVVRLPNSRMKSSPSTFHGPRVSMAIVTKWYVGDNALYFCPLRTAECATAAQAELLADCKCDIHGVSGLVAYQASHLSLDHGMSVAPSGRRLHPTSSPDGSFVAAMRALPRARCTMSLIMECL